VKFGILGTLAVSEDDRDVPVPGTRLRTLLALLVVTLGAALAGVLAALVPARRAARIDVLKAVASS